MKMLIAEQFNMQRRERWEDLSPERWVQLSWRLNVFRKARSRQKLAYAGVDWEVGLNLTPPAPQGVAWDETYARRVAEVLWPRLLSNDLTYLCGKRVQQAFGLPHFASTIGLFFVPSCLKTFAWELRDHDDPRSESEVMCVPHPSGLSRWWNQPGNAEFLDMTITQRYGDLRCSS